MAIPLQITGGQVSQFGPGDDLQLDTLLPRTGTTLTLGDGTSTVQVPGDLAITGTQTVGSTASFNGTVNLGDGTGDSINIGGGGADIVNLQNNLTVGAGAVSIGSGTTDYLLDLWLDVVAGSPADGTNDAVEIGANASRLVAGANALGVGTGNLTNSAPGNGDLQTVLEALDAAIGSATVSLQTAYQTGNTIDVTAANGSVALSNTTGADATDVLTLDVSGGATGNAAVLTDGTNTTNLNAGSVSNDGGNLSISTATNGAGAGFDIVSTAGDGTTQGGAITSTAGAGTASFGNGGAVLFQSGAGFGGAVTDAGGGGNASLLAGAGGDATASSGFGGQGGTLTLTAGAGGAGAADGGGGSGGEVNIAGGVAGASAGTPGAGGRVTINGGVDVSGGAPGDVEINTTANTGNVTIGNAVDNGNISLVGPTAISFTGGAGGPAFGITTDTPAAVASLTGTLVAAATNSVQQIDLAELTATIPTVAIYSVDGDPDTIVTANRGSFALDGSNGAAYLNTSAGATGTTWSQISTGAAVVTLQNAYEAGNTIDVTAAEGTVLLRNNTVADATVPLSIDRSPASGTVVAQSITLGSGVDATSVALSIDVSTSGAGAIVVTDGTNVLNVDEDSILGTASTVTMGAQGNAGGAGQTARFQAGGGSTDGGNLQLAAGAATSGDGGSVTISGGNSSAAGVGGNITLNAGAPSDVAQAGGNISLNAGAATTSGAGGDVNINAGSTDTGSAGSITLLGGTGTGATATGGRVTVAAGAGTGATADGGELDLQGGSGNAVGGTGGNVNITGGSGNVDGDINMGVTNTTNINIGDIGLPGNVVLRAGGTTDISFGARGGTITLNEVGDTTLDGGFTATSIIGALNELLGAAGGGSLQTAYDAGNTIDVDNANSVTIRGNAAGAVTPLVIEHQVATNGVEVTDNTNTLLIRQNTVLSDNNPTFGGANNVAGAGASATFRAGDGSTTGGVVNVLGGTGTAGGGGNVLVGGGSGTSSGGNLTLNGGAASAAFGPGGDININGGGAGSSGQGGEIRLLGGQGDTVAGPITIEGGSSQSVGSQGATVTIFGGTPLASAANTTGGLVNIEGGAGNATNGTGGAVTIDGGSGGTTAGAILIGDQSADLITIGNTIMPNDLSLRTNLDINLTARGSTIQVNEAGDTSLDGSFTATSIVGALNELATGAISAQTTIDVPIENGVTIAAGDIVASGTTAGRVELFNANANTNGGFIGIATVGGTGDAGGTVSATIAVAGRVTGLSGLSQGAVFASSAGTGAPTSTAPSGVGNLSFRVGYAYSATEMVIHAGEGTVL